jgi:single-stranded DNA-binding protein
MSNSGTFIVNLGKDPEELQLGERTLVKLRCAEKAGGKKAITRWFTALVSGLDASTAMRLRSGDRIAVTGELALTEYTKKGGKGKGETVREDEMPFAKILNVIKSPSFFSDTDAAPALDAPADGPEVPDLEGL